MAPENIQKSSLSQPPRTSELYVNNDKTFYIISGVSTSSNKMCIYHNILLDY